MFFLGYMRVGGENGGAVRNVGGAVNDGFGCVIE